MSPPWLFGLFFCGQWRIAYSTLGGSRCFNAGCFGHFSRLSWSLRRERAFSLLAPPEITQPPLNDLAQLNTETSSQELRSKELFWTRALDDPIAVFTLALVISTIGLVISTIGLWLATGRTARRQAADTRILQRAYLSVEPLGIGPQLPDPSSSQASTPQVIGHLAVRKLPGHLPARHVSWTIHMEPSGDGNRDTFPITEPRYGDNVLTAGTMMRHGGPALPWQGERYFYVWGDVIYKDGFNKDRSTRYCHRYNAQRFKDQKIKRKYGRIHDHGNDAD